MKRSRGLVVVVTATLFLALWVTAGASRVTIVVPRSGLSAEERQAQQVGESGEGSEAADPPPGAGDQNLPDAISLLFQGLVGIFAAIILVWLAWAMLAAFRSRRRRRTALERVVVPDHHSYDAFLEDAHRELVTATQDQLAALQGGEPRNAIVACWVALEDAVERAGVARDPAETSTEFTERVVHRVTLDGRAVGDLAALYREARFSQHPMAEQHRERAIALLTRLAEQLQQALIRRRSVASTTAGPPDATGSPQ